MICFAYCFLPFHQSHQVLFFLTHFIFAFCLEIDNSCEWLKPTVVNFDLCCRDFDFSSVSLYIVPFYCYGLQTKICVLVLFLHLSCFDFIPFDGFQSETKASNPFFFQYCNMPFQELYHLLFPIWFFQNQCQLRLKLCLKHLWNLMVGFINHIR